MARLKEHPSLISPGVYVEGGVAGVSKDQVAPATADDKLPMTVFDPSKPNYSIEEVAKHDNAESAWIAVNNNVRNDKNMI